MNRLTRRDKYGKADTSYYISAMFFDKESKKVIEKILESLASYEDLELTPEQIREVDRLYASKCKEVAELKKELDEAQRFIENDC